jgi:hypothetical protein
MKKNKLAVIISVAAIMVIGVSTAVFAATQNDTPAEIVADLTGKTEDEVIALRQEGQSYGFQAKEAGKLAEFQEERLILIEQDLEKAVQDQKMTQDEADARLEQAQLRAENCDGTGSGQGPRIGQGNGVCDGTGAGAGAGIRQGNGPRDGTGMGAGNGQGNRNGGICDGDCVVD